MTEPQSSAQPEDLVCVTGASGFIASHLVAELLRGGYRVRSTVRDPSDEKKTAHLCTLAEQTVGEVREPLPRPRGPLGIIEHERFGIIQLGVRYTAAILDPPRARPRAT